jgi:hypothetical protein
LSVLGVSRRLLLSLGLVAVLATSPTAFAWGPVAHQVVSAKAIDTLPKGLQPFYKIHRYEMPTLSPEGIPGEEGPERRFAIDHFLPFPFADIPRTEASLKAKHGDAASQAGRLPWLISESYGRLVAAFKAGDKTKILDESDVIAGFVADLHNPLALTDNYDGQKTEQHGLWIRFSVKLPQVMEKRLKLNPDAARFLDKPDDFVFAIINATYIWLDNLLYEEELAHRGKSGYTEIYYDTLEGRAGDILKSRLSRAAEDVGSYWYSAWTDAGRPELK